MRLRVLAACVLLTAIVAAIFLPDGKLLDETLDAIQRQGAWGAAWIVPIYIVAAVLFLPGSAISLAAGFLFGFWRAYLAVTIGSVAGATVAFLLGRYLARERVKKWVAGNPRFNALYSAVARHGFRVVLLTRLSPVFPFNLLNYALALTNVRLRDYVLASWLGMIPGTVTFVYIGAGLNSLAEAIDGDVEYGAGSQALFVLGLIATIAVTVLITRAAKAALREEEDLK